MSWIDDFLKECEGVETPLSWLKWGAICTISAIISPNVYFNKGGKYKLRPNLYVLLIGTSGLGKAFPITQSKILVGMVGNTRVISGRATIEGVIKDLAAVPINEKPNPGQPIIAYKDARGYFVSGEFAASMHKNSEALTILTDLYDAHDNPNWKDTLRSSSGFLLNRPNLTLFSGANQDMFNDAVPRQNLYGGFIGRTLLVVEYEKSKLNSLIWDAPEVNHEKLAVHLRKISQLEGKFKLGEGAGELYDKWYLDYQEKNKFKISSDKTGTLGRIHDHAIKVAMCIALSKRIELVLEMEDIYEAIELCLQLQVASKPITAGQGGTSMSAHHLRAFLMIITSVENNAITKDKMLARGFGEFNAAELDQVVDTLEQSKFIKTRGTNPMTYTLTEAGKELWGKIQASSGEKKP